MLHCRNNRLISILSCISKIIERLMHKRLSSFLSRYNILYQCQYGFRDGYSTNLALLETMDQVHKALNDGNYVLGLYLDLSKAFDTMNHSLLLKTLYQYGIRGTTHGQFSSYLSNRKQYVHIYRVKSAQCKIEIGVPQGFCFGTPVVPALH